MDLWQILALSTVRLALDCDYDRLEYLVQHDNLLRGILGIPRFYDHNDPNDPTKHFTAKTLSNNVCLLDDDLLREINLIVAASGREVFRKKTGEKIEVKVDSYVFEANIHHPTDCNLLWDSGRKCIELIVALFIELALPGWRKSKLWKNKLKKAVRECERTASGGGANKQERSEKDALALLEVAYEVEQKVQDSLQTLRVQPMDIELWLMQEQINYFHTMLIKHIDLVDRRLIKGETIPHEEKVFSIFEPHAELIKKGKQRPPVEFGHRLMVCTDQNELILDYRVMEGGSEVNEIVRLADRLLTQYGEDQFASLSTDRGFSSRENRELLELYIPTVVMPKRGKRNAEETVRESAP